MIRRRLAPFLAPFIVRWFALAFRLFLTTLLHSLSHRLCILHTDGLFLLLSGGRVWSLVIPCLLLLLHILPFLRDSRLKRQVFSQKRLPTVVASVLRSLISTLRSQVLCLYLHCAFFLLYRFILAQHTV